MGDLDSINLSLEGGKIEEGRWLKRQKTDQVLAVKSAHGHRLDKVLGLYSRPLEGRRGNTPGTRLNPGTLAVSGIKAPLPPCLAKLPPTDAAQLGGVSQI